MEQNMTQYVDSLFTNITGFTQQEGLIGKSVKCEDKTFIPVMSLTFGYGGKDSESKGRSAGSSQCGGFGSMVGGALGAGAKLCTDAVIVVDKDNVSVVPIGMGAAGQGLMDKIPQIINGMKSGGQQSGSGQGQQGQQQNQQQSQPSQNQQMQG